MRRSSAIKLIRPEAIAGSDPLETRNMLKRFELEAQATASLSSAHTIDIYDDGVTEDGTFYYVMELLDGVDCDVAASVPDLRITHPQEAVGTPQFMAPEVALGQPLDGRADLYGLGCVAYWLATGRPVFRPSWRR